MITRKDLYKYDPYRIYNSLLYIVKIGQLTIQDRYWYSDDELLQKLIHADGHQLMNIIRGYAKYGKVK